MNAHNFPNSLPEFKEGLSSVKATVGLLNTRLDELDANLTLCTKHSKKDQQSTVTQRYLQTVETLYQQATDYEVWAQDLLDNMESYMNLEEFYDPEFDELRGLFNNSRDRRISLLPSRVLPFTTNTTQATQAGDESSAAVNMPRTGDQPRTLLPAAPHDNEVAPTSVQISSSRSSGRPVVDQYQLVRLEHGVQMYQNLVTKYTTNCDNGSGSLIFLQMLNDKHTQLSADEQKARNTYERLQSVNASFASFVQKIDQCKGILTAHHPQNLPMPSEPQISMISGNSLPQPEYSVPTVIQPGKVYVFNPTGSEDDHSSGQ